MAAPLSHETKDRLLAAAAELFAERGFRGATMRQIAERGSVNLASSHYHYGSKRELYFAVLRAQFAEIQAALEHHGAKPPAKGFEKLNRPQLVGMLHSRTQVMLKMLLGPRPGLHGALMQREMCDPSEALPVIVDELLRPLMAELKQILARLAPSLDQATIERCAFGWVGQVLFYQTARPAFLLMKGRREYPSDFVASMADHIVEFSLAGLAQLASTAAKRTSGSRKRKA